MTKLQGKVTVVTGASRGGGRGIALALGEAGAIVYVTGRSVNNSSTGENLPGTIAETAELVTARGGVGIPVYCNHKIDAEVEALFARVQQEQGKLDILVNNAWGGYENYNGDRWSDSDANFIDPFWQHSMQRWEGMFTSGVRSHLLSSRYAVPLMLPHRQGLIVNTTAWDRDKYLGNLFYDLAKNAVNRLSFAMALELQGYNIAALSLAPGWMRTERVIAALGEDLDYNLTESPEYIGRAIVALASDAQIMKKSGQILAVGDLAQEYNFTDIDGRVIPPFKLE
ncbi:MAG TPA: SDR family NAD(P)-dependent oxidoreductase [Nostocaceae cyanobacterium]|nr:SDR family NAD(P)-dependent oxidoreductase [Nostocaceae cyanobacterium]